MAIRPELKLRLPNSPGALLEVSQILANEHIDILALMLERGGDLRLVVDNHVRASAVLREHHHQVTEGTVIAIDLPKAHGSLAPVLAIANGSGVNIEYAYSGSSGQGPTVVLGVGDALKAAGVTGL